ncbi:MAG: sigma-70 family RNA polymerase sigma factor [Patescibacteria group bacterium]|nr:sigma-70 family RNA polymerase sigma factor [Patescibacteria group bacterium]
MPEEDLNPKEIDALVRKAQDGDTRAFSQIYDKYFTPIYRYIYYRANKADVDDIVAQVFMNAWDNLHKYQSAQGASFGSWVFRIAHNLVVDQYRKHRGISEIPTDLIDDRDEVDPRHQAQLKLDQVQLKSALQKLKESHRQVIVLKYINGFSNQEIAEVLKRKEGNVRILQFRALKELKKVLKEAGYKR